jgi:hypothetical protein
MNSTQIPLEVTKDCNVQNLAVQHNVENTGSSSTVTFYIHDDSNNGFPGTKLFEVVSSEGILIGSQKVIELAIGYGLESGNYWIGFHTRNLNTASANPTFIGGVISQNSVLEENLSFSTSQNSHLFIAGQTANVGNNPEVSLSVGTNASLPQIFIKLS